VQKTKPTNASQGSRTDAHGGDSRGELVAAIDAAQREYDEASARVRSVQVTLAELSAKVKGRQLSEHHYRTICESQSDAKRKLADKKRRLKSLNDDLARFDSQKKRSKGGEEIVGLLRQLLTEVRIIRTHLAGDANTLVRHRVAVIRLRLQFIQSHRRLRVDVNERRDWCGLSMDLKGFHDDGSGFNDGGMVRASLVMTEIVEAMQEVKRHWKPPVVDAVRDKIAEELADTAIRLYDLAFCAGVDLDADYGPMESPRDLGRNERHSLIIRCGKVASFASVIFDTFEEVHDMIGRVAAENWTGGLPFDYGDTVAIGVVNAVEHLESLCRLVGRDLQSAMVAKMRENMARPQKYGTPDADAGGVVVHRLETEPVFDAHGNHIDDRVTRYSVGVPDSVTENREQQRKLLADIKARLLAGETVKLPFGGVSRCCQLPTNIQVVESSE
jgi:hypothetical protein